MKAAGLGRLLGYTMGRGLVNVCILFFDMSILNLNEFGFTYKL
jgi:hypothetical protein